MVAPATAYNGYMHRYRATSWAALRRRIETLTAGSEFFWRGQASKSWALSSSLFRFFERHGIPVAERQALEERAIASFRRHYRRDGLEPGHFPEESLVDLMSVMQHYGCPTRLLDWSWSAEVALYFCVIEAWDGGVLFGFDIARYTDRLAAAGGPAPHGGAKPSGGTASGGGTAAGEGARSTSGPGSSGDGQSAVSGARSDRETDDGETARGMSDDLGVPREIPDDLYRRLSESDFRLPVPVQARALSPRRERQRSVFLMDLDLSRPTEHVLDGFAPDLMHRIAFPSAIKVDILNELRRRDVDGPHLFEGLEGIARYAKDHLLGFVDTGRPDDDGETRGSG